jgi:hypothetical protein
LTQDDGLIHDRDKNSTASDDTQQDTEPYNASMVRTFKFTVLIFIVLLATGTKAASQAKVRIASTFKGSDAGEQIKSAIDDIPNSGGTVAADFEGRQNWSSCPFGRIGKPVVVELAPATFRLNADCTVPPNVVLRFNPGSVIVVAASHTLTINGEIAGTLTQHFAGPGSVKIHSPFVDRLYPHWWYDGNGDWSSAFQKAVDAGLGGAYGGLSVRLPAGIYPCTDTVIISSSRVQIEGAGKQTTIIRFEPTSAKTLFKFTAGPAMLFQVSVKNLTLAGNNSVKKIGIEFVDTSESTIEDVAFYPWSGGSSEAIQLRGREATYVNRVSANADLPLHISDNPNHSIDADHLSVTDSYFTTNNATPGPVVLVDSGVNLTNVNFSRGAWVKGTYGFFWHDTASKQTSESLTFRDIRWEQQDGKAGEIIHIVHNTTLYNLRLENLRWGGTNPSNGIYLRNVRIAVLANLIYDQAGTAIDIASPSVDGVHFESVYLNNPSSKVLLSGAQRVDGCYFISTSTVCLSLAP